MQSLLHQTARAFAEAGIPVFPCVAGGKQPATANGFHAATCDLAQIDAWWTENPEYNVALCPEDAGWAVVDLDPPVGVENWQREFADAPPTYTVKTPRGGLHLYYAGSAPSTVSKLGEKIDTRGRGGYVLVPPSVSYEHNATYEVVDEREPVPLPDRVGVALSQSVSVATAADERQDLAGSVERARSLLASYVGASDVAVAGSGGDDRTYRLCAEVLNLGLSPARALELIEEIWNPHCVPPWSTDELMTKIVNAMEYAQNEAGAWAVAPAAEVFGAALDKLPKDQRERRSRFHPEDEAEQETGKDPAWLVPQLIQEASTVLLLGQTQSYKSFLALDIALAIASQSETFLAVPASQGPVFYAALEGKTNIKKQRRRAWKLARSVESISDFYVMNAPMIALDGEMQEFGDEIAKKCGDRKPRLIVLDTLAKCMAGLNENDAGDAGRFIRFCDSLVEAFGCTVVAIHHTGKDDARGARGSSAFHAGFDSVIEVKASRATKAVEVWVRKHKDAEERETPWTFQGRSIGPSLVFFPTTADEHRELTSKSDPLSTTAIGRVLAHLKAYGEDAAVTTTVLAAELYQGQENEAPEARQAGISALARKLGSLSKTKLQAYCSTGASGIIWWLPAA